MRGEDLITQKNRKKIVEILSDEVIMNLKYISFFLNLYIFGLVSHICCLQNSLVYIHFLLFSNEVFESYFLNVVLECLRILFISRLNENTSVLWKTRSSELFLAMKCNCFVFCFSKNAFCPWSRFCIFTALKNLPSETGGLPTVSCTCEINC
jgi:hypothetical protein